jgi:acyl dehydratase
MTAFVDLFEGIREQGGRELGLTEWFTIDQVKNDIFGHLTRDRQQQYSDSEWAKSNAPNGTTVVNPLFTLALHAGLSLEMGIPIRTTEEVTAFNYGYDSVTWNAPIPVGAKIRARVTVTAVDERRPGHFMAKVRVDYEIEGATEPAVVAETALYCLPPHEVEEVKAD